MNSIRFTTFLLICLLVAPPTNSLAQSSKKKKRDDMTYFQSNALADSLARLSLSTYTYRLQPGDVLAIAVTSLNTEADMAFNPFARMGVALTAGGGGGISTQETNNLPIGYRVSEQGSINFPKLGAVPVVGRSLAELETTLRDTLKTYLREPYVAARLLSFKISVMGEVQRPSVFTVQNERITLTEAISLAGDLTVYGKRDNIMVVREVGGKREFIPVDLTSRDVFTSPAYYLKPNDVIYVEPKSGRKLQASRTLPLLPVILSSATLVATVILNLIR
ncbi:polysaccharide biosynthesis/export family protein [Fibrella aquatilis]|uniref:Polysaccharide biosynthesis/export family protein n=1 Tax=Fibrella aquatilis TaxID=2817059 RepID=A0A939G802_9BACT|nr:polysaccharide biosynthesis/export family protein [Fibrella aquatilis]MBO0933556.1 polysaccharide biosynthesis/export family protein [Fibrella aquatilis]